MKNLFVVFVLCCALTSCTKQKADALFYNGNIYTVDSAFNQVQAMVIDRGRILFTGTEAEARSKYDFTNEQNLNQSFVYPGFVDAHCHFYGYATDLDKCNLTGTKSWSEILEKMEQHAAQFTSGWLLARGWDQNDWADKTWPDNQLLNQMFPTRPVMMMRIDGHALIANDAALKLANVTAATKVFGGEVVVRNNRPTGLLIDNAMELVRKVVPVSERSVVIPLLAEAEEDCFSVGLTTVSDAGLTKEDILLMDTLQREGKLKIRLYAMVSDSAPSKKYFLENGVLKTDRMHVCSFKYYADGALGSRGAAMREKYSDANTTGFILNTADYFTAEALQCAKSGFQMNTHCIGDSAVHLMLGIYAKTLKGKNDKRWRIEHCQVVNAEDLPMFSNFSVVPSVQPTHATSDMYWAEQRLGSKRVKEAYAYNDLLKSAGMVANGSDFPVEAINPLFGFYAAVARKDQKGFPEGGFQKENALSREDALRGMTIWAAYSNFEEMEKGSLEPGKMADFVILDSDLMKTEEAGLFKLQVKQTWLNGEKVFERK